MTKHPKAGRSVLLDAPGREVGWLKLFFHAIIESCRLKWRRLTGEVDEEKVPGDEDDPYADCLELLLQRDAG